MQGFRDKFFENHAILCGTKPDILFKLLEGADSILCVASTSDDRRLDGSV